MSKFISGRYIESTPLKKQGSRKKISKYLEKGYQVRYENNGFWILYKPTMLEMTFEENNEKYVFDMKNEAREYFGKERISKKTANKFIEAVKNGDIIVKICPEDGTYSIHQKR